MGSNVIDSDRFYTSITHLSPYAAFYKSECHAPEIAKSDRSWRFFKNFFLRMRARERRMNGRFRHRHHLHNMKRTTRLSSVYLGRTSGKLQEQTRRRVWANGEAPVGTFAHKPHNALRWIWHQELGTLRYERHLAVGEREAQTIAGTTSERNRQRET